MRGYRHGIPVGEVEVAVDSVRRRVAPGIGLLIILIGRAVPLCLGRKRGVGPLCVRVGLLVRGIHRCIERQRHLVEHAAQRPRAVTLAPEQWRLAACFDKAQVFGVGDFVLADFKRRNRLHVSGKLVVPTEFTIRLPQPCRTRRDANELADRRRSSTRTVCIGSRFQRGV